MQGLACFLHCLITFLFQVTGLLNRMQLRAQKSLTDDNDSKITVSVPPTRSDVLHPCDVMEVFLVDLRIFLMCLSASNML